MPHQQLAPQREGEVFAIRDPWREANYARGRQRAAKILVQPCTVAGKLHLRFAAKSLPGFPHWSQEFFRKLAADKRSRTVRRVEITFRDQLLPGFGDSTPGDAQSRGEIPARRNSISRPKSARKNSLAPFPIDLMAEGCRRGSIENNRKIQSGLPQNIKTGPFEGPLKPLP